MKLKLLYLLMLLVCVGCAKDEVALTGDIYGKVTDAFSGEPLQSATVTLTPGGSSATTGSEGTFEFKDLEPGQYELQIAKAGYITNTKRVTVTVGGVASGDVALESDRDIELSVSSLNFGTTNTSLSFEIRNLGSSRCSWNISGLEDINWLEFTPTTGTLEAGKSNAVKVVLLRDKLTENKEATILVNANKESIALKITAEVEVKSSKIELSTRTLNFGREYSSLTFDIKNIGNAGIVNWSITGVDVDWITVSPKSGSTEMGKSSVVKVDLDRSKLTGNVTTNIIVSADGESLPVTINAEVGAARTWASHPQRVDFGANSESSLLLYSYNGKTDYTLTVRGDASWLKLSKTSGTINEYKEGDNSTVETIALTVDRTGLEAGTYECVLVAQSDLGELQIPVTMEVGASGSGATGAGEIITYNADFEFTLEGCTITGTTATINFSMKNISSTDLSTGYVFATQDGYIYDDLGNQYTDATITIGSQSSGYSVSNTIPAGVSVKCSYEIENVNQNASSFYKIKLATSSGEYLIFKNIAIEGRSKYTEPVSTVSGEIVEAHSDLDIEFTSTRIDGASVTINFMMINNSSEDVWTGYVFAIQDGYIYDNAGNQYTDATITIGSASGTYSVSNTIPAGGKVKGSYTVKNVATDATRFSSIKLSANDFQDIYFKNVKFR